MKILILTDGVYPFVIGGMQKHSFYLSKFLALQGHDVTLVHCVNHNKDLPTHQAVLEAMEISKDVKLETIAIRFPKPGMLPGHYLKESYIYSRYIYNRLKDRLYEFDFIYAKGFSAWHLLHQKRKGEKMPPIGVKFHGYEMFQQGDSLKQRLEAWMLRSPVKWNNQNADFIFSYGGKITSLIERLGIDRKKIIEIPTGIEASWCLSALPKHERDEVHFVFVGRYERRKGVEELTAVLRELINTEQFHFHFVGPIPPSQKIKSELITYHGQLTSAKELQKVLDTCDVLVAPSHSEGMPNVIMEGMARGLAIVATDVGAVASAVSSKNGWLIAPRDASTLKQTLQNICAAGTAACTEKRKASLKEIVQFTWEKMAAVTSQKILAVIDKA